jgi:hypothetical protein
VNDDAVSGIIGEMLLLCIVVVLAAVLSANINSLMPEFRDVPHATFMGKSGQNFTIIHEGGEPVPLRDLRIIIDNGTVTSCDFNGNPFCRLNDTNNNNCWDFGEVLEIYGSGDRVKITIAHREKVLCRIFFGW